MWKRKRKRLKNNRFHISAANLTVDASSVDITSSNEAATIHGLGLKLGMHEFANQQTQLLQ